MPITRVVPLLLLAAALPGRSALAQQGPLTAQERHGKQIYLRGSNTAGIEITAYLGNPPMEVPGSLMACANCHGYDGRGKPEGGVVPTTITWPVLTKPYGVVHESGRKHPPYNDGLLERAVASGLDPAGNTLSPAMPRYKLSREDWRDLAAYLKRLGNDLDPGLTEDTIIIGTIVPANGRLAEVGAGIQAVLGAYFSDVNERGGIYNRKLQLRVASCGRSAAETRDRLRQLIDDEKVFALAAVFMAGADQEIASLLQEHEVPLLGPVALHPQTAYPLNRAVFYLFPGIKEEARALARFSAQTFDIPAIPPAIVCAREDCSSDVPLALEQEFREAGWQTALTSSYSSGTLDARSLAVQLKNGGANVVFFLGSGRELAALITEAGKIDWKPNILSPVSLTGKDALSGSPGFQGRLYLSFPMRSSDQSPAALMEYRAFMANHNIADTSFAGTLSAYSAARLLEEGLKKAGREVSREKLIVALEGLYKFSPGLTPPLTYGPNRRIGAQGAYVVEVDFANKALGSGKWIELQ